MKVTGMKSYSSFAAFLNAVKSSNFLCFEKDNKFEFDGYI